MARSRHGNMADHGFFQDGNNLLFGKLETCACWLILAVMPTNSAVMTLRCHWAPGILKWTADPYLLTGHAAWKKGKYDNYYNLLSLDRNAIKI
jgi:hypothetical protein